MSNTVLRSIPALLAATLLAAASWDLLTWRAPLGLGAALACLGLQVLTVLRWPRALEGAAGRVLAAAALLAALSLFLEPGPAGLVLALALTVALAARGRRRGPSPAWEAAAALAFPVVALHRGVADMLRKRRGPARRRTLSLGPWLVPSAVAGAFAVVFAVGDELFERAAFEVLRRVTDLLTPEPARLALWIAAGLGAWGLLRWRLPRGLADAVTAMARHEQQETAGITAALAVRTLVLLHAVFLMENLLGVRHAWMGVPVPEGMTLAEGAQRAAMALLLAAALSAGLTLVAFVRGGAVERDPAARGLAIAWMGQVAMLLATAILLLHRYVLAYSLTRLRLAAMIWLALVAAGILLLAARLVLRRDNGWLLRGASVATLVVLLGVACTDVDGIVARFNVRHCRELGGGAAPLDVRYLASLGPSALPAAREAIERLAAAERPAPDVKLWEVERAAHDLARRFRGNADDWRGFSLRRRRLSSVTIPSVP